MLMLLLPIIISCRMFAGQVRVGLHDIHVLCLRLARHCYSISPRHRVGKESGHDSST